MDFSNWKDWCGILLEPASKANVIPFISFFIFSSNNCTPKLPGKNSGLLPSPATSNRNARYE